MMFFDTLVRETAPAREAFMALPVLQRAAAGDATRDEYRAFLGQAFHHVRHTVPLMMACGSCLPEPGHWLRPAIGAYIQEKMGHEEWILDDLRACGGDAAAVSGALPAPAAELMAAYAYDVVQRRDPIGFFGMVLVLEGTSVRLASAAARAIQRTLRLPDGAFRYLTSHGALDQDHMTSFKRLMNRLGDRGDRNTVIHCANMFYRLYGNVFLSIAEH